MSNDEHSSALKEAQARHRQIVDSARSFAIIVSDLQGRITDWNAGAEHVLGWTEEEMLGQTMHRFFTPEDIARGRPETEMRCALEQGFSPDERWHLRKHGQRFWAAGEMTPLKDEAGNVCGFVKILCDRTGQRRTTVELAQLNATLEARVAERTRERDRLWRNSQDLLLVISPDGRFQGVNPAWTRLLGYTEQELLGKRVEEYVHPDDAEATRAAMREARSTPLAHFEARSRARDGSHRSIVWVAASEEGVIYANGRDVSRERAQAEELARTNAARLRLALAVGEMGVWEWDVRSDRVRWLEGAAALHGCAPHEQPADFTMERYAQLIHVDDRGRLKASIEAAISGGRIQRVEYRTIWPDGSVHWLEARGEMFFDAEGRPAVMSGVTVDMTRRKKTERDLEFIARASAELARLVEPRSALDKLAQLAVPSFADWCVVDMLGEDGTLERVAAAHVDPDKVQFARDLYRRFPPDPAGAHGAWKVIRTGRTDIVQEVTDEILEYAIRNPDYRAALRELGLRSFIGVPIVVHGRATGVVSFITAESGRLYEERDLAVAEDMARRASVAIENARLYQVLQESDRGKDVFLATLAHELRNPLSAIANAMKVVELSPDKHERVRAATRIVGRQIGQLTHLVDDLMDVSRITTGKIELRRERVDLRAVLSGALENCRAEIEAGQHELTLALPPEPAELLADPNRLTQVFANLLSNAAKYTERGGRIALALEATPGEFVVRVRDTGVGIPAERLQDVFRMFSQITHPLERSQGGLGIGLALVDGLVRLHGGRVEALSAGAGQGSEFVVRLPRPPQQAAETPAAAAAAQPGAQAGPGRRILVVDDNVDASEALAQLLGLLGHEVVGLVHEGIAALEAAQRLEPDIVLLDIGLPGLNGYEVARRLREQPGGRRRPILVALTGWGMDSDKARAFEAGFDRHWVKPVGLEQLSELATLG
ncbi:PAS domain S-box protein [Caldimonas tepidiphila]|uniref:hybrid sensor histidine kinase/response regulator n=1 Tax=Caldimonas tepidiphila TaxID=2315841 RepID=UPI000E5B3B31|nr:PAS domain S-box protein [Caldimonas tepidiphila]